MLVCACVLCMCVHCVHAMCVLNFIKCKRICDVTARFRFDVIHVIHLLCRYDEEVVGGESLLLDSYPVLEEMRTQHPKEFDTLTRIPAKFQQICHNRYILWHNIISGYSVITAKHQLT